MKSFTVLINAPGQDTTMKEFAEFFTPIYESGRGDIVDVDDTSVITFLDDEDVVVMHLTFGNKIEAIDPPHDWEARAMRWWPK
jgi:hypothetical protein